MKKFLSSIMLPAIAFMALNSNATTLTNVGPLTISWKVYQQGLSYESTNNVTLSTNHTAKATNYVTKYKFTTTSAAFNDASLLGLLANSFNTNFPSGSKLATDGEQRVYVVDKTGSNVVMDISSVLWVSSETSVYSGGLINTVSVPKATNAVTTTSAIGTGSTISYMKLNYDDSGILTNKVTTFHFDAVSMGAGDYSTTNSYLTEQVKQNFTGTGVGHGTIQGTTSVISGSVAGSSKGTSTDD